MTRTEKIKETSNSYLSFRVDKEVFAVHVAHVSNIIEVPYITHVPDTPDYMLGVINLRGGILPVIDTRMKMKMPPSEFSSQTCVLVMEITHGDGILQVGAIVDSVHEVIEIEDKNILPPPSIQGVKRSNEFILGIVNYNDSFIMLIDVDVLLHEDNLGNIHEQINAIKEELQEIK